MQSRLYSLKHKGLRLYSTNRISNFSIAYLTINLIHLLKKDFKFVTLKAKQMYTHNMNVLKFQGMHLNSNV